MGTRKTIALTYNYSENWIAGSYYVANIIKALNTLPESQKPSLIILFHKNEGLYLIKEIAYPFITFLCTNINSEPIVLRTLRKLSHRLFGKDYWLQLKLKNAKHIFEGNNAFFYIPNHYFWVHDFQELRLPSFFSLKEATERAALPTRVATIKEATLILSSYDALNDFNTFFPTAVCKVRVLRFASSLPNFNDIDLEECLKKFDIKYQYFICSNQFWQHKNHKIVLTAINNLKDKNLKYQVIFTGKKFDHRNPDYFASLQKYVDENDLGGWVKFLGFIDRKVQLKLASGSLSYIQPSLFEGWSTTVEDAKCMNQHIILSNIPVHIEQLNYNVDFFDPQNAQQLAHIMERIITAGVIKQSMDYQNNIELFGKDILQAFSDD
jgi:glycosyltransferase involved in cell wall biosynthesis